MRILGIESSCDDTAAAVVEDGRHLLSSVINSQADLHAAYGGVVPEVAARSHIEIINPVINQALRNADLTWDDIDAIAVTYAPGLVGSLLIGTLAARTYALVKQKPLYPVYHVEAHPYASFLNESIPQFPALALIVSGLHAQLVLFKGHGDYALLGQTRDDAVGEAFDKVAKVLGLPYPGGPSIAKAATSGDPQRFTFPKATLDSPYDFSFSGLKTAVLRAVQREVGVSIDFPSFELRNRLDDTLRSDFAASFQYIAAQTLVDKTARAFTDFSPRSVIVAGGVAANLELRRQLSARLPIEVDYAPLNLCTDNAAMIAALGYYKAQVLPPVSPLELEVEPSLSMKKTAWNKSVD